MKRLPSALLIGVLASLHAPEGVAQGVPTENQEWTGTLLISYGRFPTRLLELDASGETLWNEQLETKKVWQGGSNVLLDSHGIPLRIDDPPCQVKARFLENGDRLVCQVEAFARDDKDFFLIQMYEVARTGKLLWQRPVTVPNLGAYDNELRSVQRLSNGNILVVMERFILEVNKDGRIVNELPCPENGFPQSFASAHQLYSGEIQVYCVGPGFSYKPMYFEIGDWTPVRKEDGRYIPEGSEDDLSHPFSAAASQYDPLNDKTFVYFNGSILCLRRNEIIGIRKLEEKVTSPGPKPECNGFEFLEDGSFFLAETFTFPVCDQKGQVTKYDRKSRVSLLDKRGKPIWEKTFRSEVHSISYLRRATGSR